MLISKAYYDSENGFYKSSGTIVYPQKTIKIFLFIKVLGYEYSNFFRDTVKKDKIVLVCSKETEKMFLENIKPELTEDKIRENINDSFYGSHLSLDNLIYSSNTVKMVINHYVDVERKFL